MKSSQQAKLAEKTEYRKSIEYLAKLATDLEKGFSPSMVEPEGTTLAKHIRRILHGARG